jgi:hypothetical protein
MRAQVTSWIGHEIGDEKRPEISVANGTFGSKEVPYVVLHVGCAEISLYLSPEAAAEIATKLFAEVAMVKAQAALRNQAVPSE